MANIRKINVGGTTYDIAPSDNPNVNTDGIFYITCDSGSSTSTIKSNLALTSYYTGLKVVLYYTLGSESSASVKLNINNLGAKRIYKLGTTSLQGGFQSNSMHFLCYNGSAFIESSYVDTNDYRNPVAGTDSTQVMPSGANFIASGDASTGSIVFKLYSAGGCDAENLLIAAVHNTTDKVAPDWGLAVYKDPRDRDMLDSSNIHPNSLLQQGFITLAEFYRIRNPYYQTIHQIGIDELISLPLYVYFHKYNDVDDGSGIETLSFSKLYTTIPTPTDVSHEVNTFVYIGYTIISSALLTYGDEYIPLQTSVYLDLSNHDFVTIAYQGQNPIVTHINGISIGSGATYDNPVSPNSYILLAGDDLYANTLIFKGEDGAGRRIAETHEPIDPDWGLGYVTQYTQSKSFTNPNTVFQQYMVNSSSGGFPYLYNYNYGEELYLCCDFVNNKIFSLNYIGTYNECRLHHSSYGSGDFTYIYLGIVASIDGSLGNNAGHILALDLSNHDFITVGTLSAQDQKAAVKAINGRIIHGSDSSTGGGWDGICDNAQTYSYLSNRTVNPNAYHYPCVVTRYENKAFLYTLNSSERGAYVAYAHVTVHNDDNVQHTVEISLCANSVGLTSTEPVAPVWSDINQKTATYLEIPPYRSATAHLTTPIGYDYKDGSPELLGYGFVIRNDDNRHCSIIGAHEASIIVRSAAATSSTLDSSIVRQIGRQFYRAAQFDISGEKPQYAWCSSGIINNLSAAGIIIYTSDDTQAITPGYSTVDGSTVIAVFKGINPSTGGAVTGTTCGVYQIGTGFGYEGNSYSYVSVPTV